MLPQLSRMNNYVWSGRWLGFCEEVGKWWSMGENWKTLNTVHISICIKDRLWQIHVRIEIVCPALLHTYFAMRRLIEQEDEFVFFVFILAYLSHLFSSPAMWLILSTSTCFHSIKESMILELPSRSVVKFLSELLVFFEPKNKSYVWLVCVCVCVVLDIRCSLLVWAWFRLQQVDLRRDIFLQSTRGPHLTSLLIPYSLLCKQSFAFCVGGADNVCCQWKRHRSRVSS